MIEWQVTSSHISSTVNVTNTLQKVLEKDGYDVQAITILVEHSSLSKEICSICPFRY